MYEYTYQTVSSMTDAQKTAVKNGMEQNRTLLEQEMRTIMSTYGVRQYVTLFRYVGSTGEVLVEVPIALSEAAG